MKKLDQKAFSLVEVLLAVAAFSLVVTGLTGMYMYGRESSNLSGNRLRATLLAEEAQEVVRNIRDQNFTNLIDGTYGLVFSGNQWTLSGTRDITGVYTRQIVISTVDGNTKEVSTNVTWQQNLQRTGDVSLTTRLTNWRVAGGKKKGLLVYGSGGITTDNLRYRVLQADGLWGSVSNMADVDTGTTNRAPYAIRIYASPTRNEKIAVSRHYNGTSQYIYAQVFNGTNWGNVQLLASWNSTQDLSVDNFDGSYLANGDFMTIFSDNTTTPKMRIWSGSTWSSQQSLRSIPSIPNYIVTANRPSTNEVMAIFFDQLSRTNSQYFNGGTYTLSSWNLHGQHSAAGPSNARRMVDFAWSTRNNLTGGLVYSASSNDRKMNIKVWTANGSGGGNWSSTANTANQSTNIGSISVTVRNNANEFLACNKDTSAIPIIRCYKSSFVPSWTTPANNTISTTDLGIQRSYESGFNPYSGDSGLIVYSDGTNIPKWKLYDSIGASWAVTPNSLNTLGSPLETIRFNDDGSNNIMVLLGDSAQGLYTAVWDGNTKTFSTSPSGHAFTNHSATGAVDENYWYDFAWDKF